MKPREIIAVAALIAGIGLALHVAPAQQPGTKRTDLMRHDLSAPGREVIAKIERDENRLKTLATRISEDASRSVKVVAADLTNDADLVRVEQALRSGARMA